MKIVKLLLPEKVRGFLRRVIKKIRYTYRFWIILLASRSERPMNIILGAAETAQKGWYSTNEQWLNITKEGDWKRIFRGESLLWRVVAEHVFEHLSSKEAGLALKHVYQHMRNGGKIRIAVPDGYNPNREYLLHVGIKGEGADADDHVQLLNVDALFQLIENAGFTPKHIEGYTSTGKLIQMSYSIEDGFIIRSRQNHSPVIQNEGWDFVDSRTSLIVDGKKN